MTTSQINGAADSVFLSEVASETVQKLVQALLAWKAESSLFNSNITGDTIPSVTVSAISALALFEAKRPEAQLTCEALLLSRLNDGPDKGAWKAQGGPYCHTIGTAWAIFSSLRVRMTCLRELGDSIRWLIDQRLPRQGGWGHVKGTQPRAYETAYVLNALLEYQECAQKVGFQDSALLATIDAAIKEGLDFLKDSVNPEDTDIYLWDSEPKGCGICLASTAISIHVLAKSSAIRKDRVSFRNLLRALEFLCPQITVESLKRTQIPIVLAEKQFELDLWPSFNHNAPHSYWNRYFTPILGVTFLDFYPEASATLKKALSCAIYGFVQWVVDHTAKQKDGHYGVRGNTGSTAYVWSTAQGIILLQRWLDAIDLYPELVRSVTRSQQIKEDGACPSSNTDFTCNTERLSPASSSNLASVLAEIWGDITTIKMVLDEHGLRGADYIVEGKTPTQVWFEALEKLKSKPNFVLELLISAEKENPDIEKLRGLRRTFLKESYAAK